MVRRTSADADPLFPLTLACSHTGIVQGRSGEYLPECVRRGEEGVQVDERYVPETVLSWGKTVEDDDRDVAPKPPPAAFASGGAVGSRTEQGRGAQAVSISERGRAAEEERRQGGAAKGRRREEEARDERREGESGLSEDSVVDKRVRCAKSELDEFGFEKIVLPPWDERSAREVRLWE